MKLLILSLAALASVLLATPALAADPPYNGTAVASLTATLVDTSGVAIGTVQLHQDATGVVLVRVDAAGLPAGAHGIHVHATGSCVGPAFASAGGHFNPTNKKHGLDSPEGAHGGDLTQIGTTFSGTGTHTVTTNRLSLTAGPLSIADADGAALVIHAAADDQLTDPTGNTGARIACAVLVAAGPAPAATTAPAPPATGMGEASDSSGGLIQLAGLGLLAAAMGLAAVRLARRGTTQVHRG